AVSNIVHANTIRNNGAAGVAIPDSPPLHNTVTANSIDLNTGLGIDLGPTGVTPNDPVPDADHFQNFPTVTTVSTTQINGTLASLPGATFNIELFRSPACDGS